MNGKNAQRNQMQRPLIPELSPKADTKTPVEPWHRRAMQRAHEMRRKAATVALIALTVSLGLYAAFGHDGIVAYQHKQQQARELQQQIQQVKQENQRLALHDQRLKSDPDTIEYEAREQMHYTRPGEVIYTLPQAPAAQQK
jgi:cell division protein FtsB